MDDSSQITSEIQRQQVLKTDYYYLFVFSALHKENLSQYLREVFDYLNQFLSFSDTFV